MKPITFFSAKAFFILIVISLMVSSAFLSSTGTSLARRPDAQINSEPVAVITRYQIKNAYQDEFRKALHDYANNAMTNEQNIMAEAFHEQDNPTVLWLIERWTGEEDRAVFKTANVSMAIEGLYPSAFVQARQEFFIKDLEPLTKEEWRRVAKSIDKPLTIMLFVDSKAGTEENFKEVYHTAMPQFRGEPGVINYQLSQLESDKTQFVTYEKFRNEEAFQYHLTFPPIKPVIDYLNTSIKQQPFQTGLHRLILIPTAEQ